MVARKKRVPVVLDTNVLVSNLLTSSNVSPNVRVCQLWLQQKRLQLMVGREVIEEYLEVFAETVRMKPDRIMRWRGLFEQDDRCTLVNLARRYTESRDPDDNLFLATATAGGAEYLITNDRDLLELPADFQARLPFAILTPQEFLRRFERS